MSNHELLVQAVRLLIIDQDQESITAKGVDGFFELQSPLNLTVFLEAILCALAIQDALGIRRLNQAPEDLFILFAIKVLHLLVNALANQLPDSDALGRKF